MVWCKAIAYTPSVVERERETPPVTDTDFHMAMWDTILKWPYEMVEQRSGGATHDRQGKKSYLRPDS